MTISIMCNPAAAGKTTECIQAPNFNQIRALIVQCHRHDLCASESAAGNPKPLLFVEPGLPLVGATVACRRPSYTRRTLDDERFGGA
jgi:hypothetical protein